MEQLKELLRNKLSILLIISLFACFIPIYYRVIYDKTNTTVEIAVDFDTVKNIYINSGVYYKNILTNFKEAGVTSIILKEDKIIDLINDGKATLLTGMEILNDNRILRGQYNLIFSRLPRNYTLQPDYSYLIIDENSLFEYTKRNLEIKLGNNRVRDLGWNILEIIAKTEDLLEISLETNLEKADMINKIGLSVIPEINNHEAFSEEQLASKLSALNKPYIKTIKFKENEALGYKNDIHITALKLNELNFFFAFTEFVKPIGMHYLATNAPNKALKIHYMILNQDGTNYVNRALKAISERNSSIIQIDISTEKNVFSENKYNETLSFIQQLNEAITKQGFSVNTITNIEKPQINNLFVFQLFAYTSVAILFLLFSTLFYQPPSKTQAFLLITATLLLGGLAHFTNLSKTYNEILALIVTIINPVTLFILIKNILDANKKTKPILTIFLLVFVTSILSGVIINTLLFHYNYFVAIWTFKGVKIANTIPILLLATFLFVRPKRIKYLYYVLNRFLSKHLTFKYLVVTIFLAFFLIFYTLRTGNHGILILGRIEIIFRELLETIFIVRPRTKEILFAVPLLLMSITYWNSKKLNQTLKYTIFIFASIVSISQINTLCHLHAPFTTSLYRSFLGLLLGYIVGLFFIFVINRSENVIIKISQKINTWEN